MRQTNLMLHILQFSKLNWTGFVIVSVFDKTLSSNGLQPAVKQIIFKVS